MGFFDFLFGKKKVEAVRVSAPAVAPAPALVAVKPVVATAPVAKLAPAMAAPITELRVGESLVGEGNEVAHIDLLIGPRGSAAETAFANALVNNKDGFTALLAVLAPNLATKPNAVMFNKVTIKGAKQAVQMFGPAQRGVAMAIADCLAEGTLRADQANELFIAVGVFIHWQAEDDTKIQDYNYRATKESIERAVRGYPSAAEVQAQYKTAKHPFAAAD